MKRMMQLFEEVMVAAAFAEAGVNGFMISSISKLSVSLKSSAGLA